MERVRNIVPRILGSQVKGSDPAVVGILKPLWYLVVGRAMASRSRPVAFREGTLKIEIHSASWNLELQKMIGEIRKAINQFLGSRMVHRIVFEYRPYSGDEKREAAHGAEEGRKIRKLIPAPEQVGAELDPELGEIFRRSMAKYFSRFDEEGGEWH